MTAPDEPAEEQPLEASYRRALRLFPPSWRSAREEEVLTVLLDAAAPGRVSATREERRDLSRAAAGAWARTGLRTARRSPGSTAGAAVLVVGVLSAVWPAGAADQAVAGALPPELPAYSYTTADVSSSPPGAAVALYQHGNGVELGDFPQAVVVGAGGSVRRLDLAEGRGEGTHGDPGAMLLSPDGTRVAVGRYDTAEPDVAVQDLRTGEVVTSPPLDGRAVLPLAWSPDGARVLAVVLPAAWPHSSGLVRTPPAGTPVLVGTDGRSEPLAASAPQAPPGVVAAAYSADGRRLAVQEPDGQVTLLDTGTGAATRLGRTGALVGAAAWSPDGDLLATSATCPSRQAGGTSAVPGRGTVLVPTGGTTPPDCLPHGRGYAPVIGWADARTLVVDEVSDPTGRSTDPQPLLAVNLASGERTRLSGVPTASSNYAVSRLQVPPAALAATADRAGVGPAVAWDHGRGGHPFLRLLGTLFAAGCTGFLVAAAAAVGRAVGERLRASGRFPSDSGVARAGVRRRRAGLPRR